MMAAFYVKMLLRPWTNANDLDHLKFENVAINS